MKTPILFSSSLFVTLGLVACGGDTPPPKTTDTTTVDSAKPAASADMPPPVASTSASASVAPPQDPTPPAKPTAAVVWKGVGLATPESVLYDAVDDRYLVSNINGTPVATDNNGFISELTPDGQVKTLKWIEGGKNNVKLDAPKGSAIVGDLLYVADITTVRIFDRKTGAPKGEVKLPGSTFLNDVVADSKGTIYVSDSGVKIGKSGFEGTGTDAVWSIDAKKKATKIAKGKELNKPNGLIVVNDKVWVNTFGAAEIYSLGPKGEKQNLQTLPKGTLDGFLQLPGGDFLVSSWESQTVYRVKQGGEATPLITDVKSPADIGWDSKRSRVLIPIFQGDEIQAWDVKQ